MSHVSHPNPTLTARHRTLRNGRPRGARPKRRGGEKKCRLNQGLVAKLLLKVHPVEVDLEDAEEAQTHKSTTNIKSSPKFGQPRPANRKEEGPREWAIHEGTPPMLHDQRLGSTVWHKEATHRVALVSAKQRDCEHTGQGPPWPWGARRGRRGQAR